MEGTNWSPLSESWFTSLVEGMDDAVAVVDARGLVRYANPAAHRLVGRTLAEHSGPIAELIHADDREVVVRRLAGEGTRVGTGDRLSVRLRSARAEWAPVEAVVTNLLADERFGGTILVLRERPGRSDAAGGSVSSTSAAQVREALAGGFRSEDVEVHYQPVVDTATGSTVGLEALARWRHPSLGLLRPGQFLDVAEAMGVVSSLDWCVLERMASDRARWREACPRLVELPLSVNISVSEVGSELEERLAAYLGSAGGAGTRLSLELGEEALADDSGIAETLGRLRDRGVGLTVDAAAGGSSALPHLARLPIRLLKLDRSLLASVAEQGAEFTATFVELYAALDVHVVAVGVETFDEHQVVRSVGIRWAQGFFYAEPMDPVELVARLSARPTPTPAPTDGRAPVAVASDGDDARSAVVRAALAAGFRSKDVAVHYQPVVDTATGSIVGLEALARWRHPSLGLLRPGDFLGVAEAAGVVSSLDWCVLERVASDRARWRVECPQLLDIPLSVNISVSEVSPDLEKRLRAFLASPGGAGTRLSLELTEQALVSTDGIAGPLARLRDWGIGLTVDAAAGGMSTLPQLAQLPIRLLKLNRAFLSMAEPGAKVTATFVEMYAGLDVHVVAVGVESLEEHQVVRSLGIRWAQGFFYAEPMDPAELVARLSATPVSADRSGSPRTSTG